MTEREKELVKKLYEHHVELWNTQGDEIEALKNAMRTLQKSHEIIGDMLSTITELVKPS